MTRDVTPRLLVVDDGEDNRIILRRRFTRLGYEVMEAADGRQALALINTYPFDLVLLDIMMPEIDGLEVLRTVRETKSAAELPIIMVTAKSASEDVVEALNAGANDYITKPVDMEVAFARAEMQIRRKREDEKGRQAFRDLEQALTRLQGAVTQAENTSALLADLGPEVRAPMSGVLGAASVLTRLCETPDLKKVVGIIETAAGSLTKLMNEALENGDRRRVSTPKTALRVLCADDDAAGRGAMREVLAQAPAPVIPLDAFGGLDAADAAMAGEFDLIVIDIDMVDGLSGVQAIRRMERQRARRRAPILALSRDRRRSAEALSAGADLHMVRPITAAGLLTALAGAISRQSEDLSAVA